MKPVKNDFFLKILLLDKYRTLRHITILVFLFVLIINHKTPYYGELTNPNLDYYLLSFAYVVLVVMFYVNMYFLVPRFLYQKHYIIYLVALIVIAAIGFYVIRLFTEFFIEPHRLTSRERQGFFVGFFNVGLRLMPFILASTTLKLFQRWIIDTEKINELESKAFESELQALKNQINPHFLFNMLNNLSVLIKKDQDKASYVTLKLSDFLRHHLYKNNQSSISLSSEVKFIDDFLSLEKIRRDDFNFEVKRADNLPKSLKIPPHIFTVFVENAVKHSLDSMASSRVEVSFDCKDGNLHFSCVNSKPQYVTKSNEKGVGLQNVKRRLELLYNNSFDISIDNGCDCYCVNLKLPL